MNTDDPRVEENIAELSQVLTRLGDGGLIKDFFYDILTPSERVAIASRWALVKALDKKKSQREIAKTLGVSLCKITRGSRELKKPDSAFRRVLAFL